MIYGVVRVQLAHFSLGDWKDISIAHVIIIINSAVPTLLFPLLSYFSVIVCLRCLLHHILSLIPYTFRENQDFVFIIIAQFMMSAISRIRFGLPCGSYSFCRTLHHFIIIIVQFYVKTLNLQNCLSDKLSSVWVRLSLFSQLYITQCRAVCFRFAHSPLGWFR